jgi:hypothetical protein
MHVEGRDGKHTGMVVPERFNPQVLDAGHRAGAWRSWL